MEVKLLQQSFQIQTSAIITTLLNEWSAITDYRTLRDTLPRRLAALLQCRYIILYLRMGETLQFASGSFDNTVGWSIALLKIAHINPIALDSRLPEAIAWRERHAILSPGEQSSSSLTAAPLLYRQRAIGVMVAYRGPEGVHDISMPEQMAWTEDDLPVLEAVAGIVALLLENTRLLERDRERIHELSLLNNIASQLSFSLYEFERVQRIVTQRAREIANADVCELLQPDEPPVSSSWISPALHTLLFSHLQRPQGQNDPLVMIERPGNATTSMYISELPAQIKTFFAIPLYSNEPALAKREQDIPSDIPHDIQPAGVSGMLVGGYYQARKMRREEVVLLQVLASQAANTIEHMRLVHDVIEARNEARKLLRQVLEDQRIKAAIAEEKRRLDRLASLGEMSASVAHEVRNPLASIKTSMQILRDDLTEPAFDIEETLESVSIVLKEVERLDAIVRDLLLFARPRQLQTVPCRLTDLSDQVVHLMQGQFDAAHITVKRIYQAHPSVLVDAAQMKQVFFNLFTNAMQAMLDCGCLTITCQIIPASYTPDAVDSITGKHNEQQWAELAVKDTGTGIAPEHLERLFQPFYTTKTHGIGLGLPISRRLVEDHRGHLLVESHQGLGTTFTLRLPVYEQRNEAEYFNKESSENDLEDML